MQHRDMRLTFKRAEVWEDIHIGIRGSKEGCLIYITNSDSDDEVVFSGPEFQNFCKTLRELIDAVNALPRVDVMALDNPVEQGGIRVHVDPKTVFSISTDGEYWTDLEFSLGELELIADACRDALNEEEP